MTNATYTEQWGGYVYAVRPATHDEILSWLTTASRMGWALPQDLTFPDAMVGWFVSPTGNAMDLPYELRSTVMRPNGDVREILAVHYKDLRERVEQDIINAYGDMRAENLRQRLAAEMDEMLGK